MKRHAFRRGLVVVAVYLVVALSLVLVQYSRNTGFTFNVGSIAVTGKYEKEVSDALGKADRDVSGPLSLFFGGMEFRLAESDGLATVRDGQVKAVHPSSISLIDGGVRVRLEDNSEIRFATMFVGGEETLRASASFAAGTSELRVPYRPMRSARVTLQEGGKPLVVSGGNSFAFSSASVDPNKRFVLLRGATAAFSYGKVSTKKGSSAGDFVLAQAAEQGAYDAARGRWLDQAFASWERAMTADPDEETIVSYTAESARRGNYRSAVATAPKSFVESGERGSRAAVYYGRIDVGFRNQLAAERETLGKISRLENERNIELFLEGDLISYISIRASKTMTDDIAAFAKTIDPATTTGPLAVGYIECWTDWSLARSDQPNPFDKLVDQARFVLSGMLRKTGDNSVFLLSGDKADIAFNLRAARAFIRSYSVSKDRLYLDLGRSLLLSCLSLADPSGALPAEATFAEGAAPAPGGAKISSARVFRTVAAETTLPRAIPLLADNGSLIWAWTAAPATAVRQDDGTIDISVDFPVGESHFMILRGVKPFKNIQLYGIDFSSDPKFERYDSSGWLYLEAERTLLLKMKHKSPTEHIRLFF